MATVALSIPAENAASVEPLPPILQTYGRAPFELVRGEGVELIDATGKRYLDFGSGIAVNALGYGDTGLARAMTDALDTGLIHVSNLYRTAPGEALAQKLIDCSFAASVFFCNSGAEANEGAFKFARKWARSIGGRGKHGFVGLRGSFHGRLFASLAATDRAQYRIPFTPLAPSVTMCERDIGDLDRALDPETVAALILEPVQGEGGVRVLDAGFLREVRALTRERRIALIFDEVQCGLGRTGTLFAYEQSGVEPDLLTLAKPLAGGLPMGAVLVSEHIARVVKPGDHATTFGGGPLVASVAHYVVNRLAAPSLLESVRENGEWLGARLRDITERSGRARAVRGVGYIWGMDVMEPAMAIVRRGWDAGILLLTAGEHTIRVLPPLVTSRQQLAQGLEILESVIV